MRLIAASRQTPATIAMTPAATPSAPSSRLTETCIPTSQTTVTGAISHVRSQTPGECPPGTAMKLIVIPRMTVRTPTPTSIASLVRQERSRMSSTAMAIVIAPVTAITCQRYAMPDPKRATAMANPANMAMPPSRGVGCGWRCRSASGSATAPVRRANHIEAGTPTMHTALATRNGGTAVSQGDVAAITPSWHLGRAAGIAGTAPGSARGPRRGPPGRRSRRASARRAPRSRPSRPRPCPGT